MQRGEVVARTERGTLFDFMTLIWFESGACVRIIDRLDDHRVEAFAT